MKYSKQGLKDLIKECLLELLTEGLGTSLNESVRQTPRSPVRQAPRQQPRMSSLDVPVGRSQQVSRPRQTDALTEAVKQSAGGNPVLADILADTAATTLQAQIQADGRGAPVAHDHASMMVASSTPEELFGDETASKWADLAFAAPSPNIRHS